MPNLYVLPYLTDRVPQKDAVLDSLDWAWEAKSGRPAVFFLDGNLNQSHYGLMCRLANFDLPKWLSLRVNNVNNQTLQPERQVDLPSSDAADFDGALRRELGLRLSIQGDPTWEELTAWLGNRPGRVLLTLTFSTSAWLIDNRARLERLLRSWEQCGDLPAELASIVCVKVIYESQPRASWFRRVLGRRGDANVALRAYLDDDLAPHWRPGRPQDPRVPSRATARRHLKQPDHLAGPRGGPSLQPGADFTTLIDALFNDPHAGPLAGLPMAPVVESILEWLRPYARGV